MKELLEWVHGTGKTHLTHVQQYSMGCGLRPHKRETLRNQTEYQYSCLCDLNMETTRPVASLSYHHAFPSRMDRVCKLSSDKLFPFPKVSPRPPPRVLCHRSERSNEYIGFLCGLVSLPRTPHCLEHPLAFQTFLPFLPRWPGTSSKC